MSFARNRRPALPRAHRHPRNNHPRPDPPPAVARKPRSVDRSVSGLRLRVAPWATHFRRTPNLRTRRARFRVPLVASAPTHGRDPNQSGAQVRRHAARSVVPLGTVRRLGVVGISYRGSRNIIAPREDAYRENAHARGNLFTDLFTAERARLPRAQPRPQSKPARGSRARGRRAEAQRTRHGRFGSKRQPFTRNCIATASSRPPAGSRL